MFTFFYVSMLLCYIFRITTPKLFGAILLSQRRAIEHRLRIMLLNLILRHASPMTSSNEKKSKFFFLYSFVHCEIEPVIFLAK